MANLTHPEPKNLKAEYKVYLKKSKEDLLALVNQIYRVNAHSKKSSKCDLINAIFTAKYGNNWIA